MGILYYIPRLDKVRDNVEQIKARTKWWNTVAWRHPREGRVCMCVCVFISACVSVLKKMWNPPSLSLAQYHGIRTARKWQRTVKEQVLLGLRCVSEQTLPHQTGCLFCTLPLSSVTRHTNHTQSRHLVIWSSEWSSLVSSNGLYVCVCVFSRLAVHPICSCLVSSSPLPFSPHSPFFFSESMISRTHGELS